LAGLLLTATSLQVVLWCDALTFVISAISLALIKTSFNAVAPQARPKTSLRRDILDGLRYVLAQPVIRTLALFSLLANLALAVLYPQIVFYAKQVLYCFRGKKICYNKKEDAAETRRSQPCESRIRK